MKKILFTVLVTVILFAVIILSLVPSTPKIVTYDRYVVNYGDTLWAIAESHYNDNLDIRQVISDIRSYNECSANIQVGQTLYLPIYEEGK